MQTAVGIMQISIPGAKRIIIDHDEIRLFVFIQVAKQEFFNTDNGGSV